MKNTNNKTQEYYQSLIGKEVVGIKIWTNEHIEGILIRVYDEQIGSISDGKCEYDVYLSSIHEKRNKYPDDIDGCGCFLAVIIAIISLLIYFITYIIELWK